MPIYGKNFIETTNLWFLEQVRRSGVKAISASKTLQDKRDDIPALAAKHGALNIRVFGSVARGEADEASDVDFLVDLEPGRSLFDLGGLLIDLQGLFDCSVDVVTSKGLKARMRDRVLREAVPL